MKLYWIRYQSGQKHKYMLVLALDTTKDTLHCLDTDRMDATDKEFMRSKSGYFDKMSLEDKVRVIKETRPKIMDSYRTIKLNNIIIDKEYNVG